MHHEKLKKLESKFRADGADGLFQISAPISRPVPKEPDLTFSFVTCSRLESIGAYFFKEVNDKKQIVLHFTMGNIAGDIRTLTGERGRISVPYVIARDGTIYRLFSSEYWAHHLGVKDAELSPHASSGPALSKQTIGIELSNYGPLTLKGTDLYTEYNTWYCTLADTTQYTVLDKPYRDYKYYAAYTELQYDSLTILLRFLTAAYGIPRKFLAETARFEKNVKNTLNFSGIVSHVNYRDGKTDIGAAFDWAKLVNGVTAATFVSIQPVPPVERGGLEEILSFGERDLTPHEANEAGSEDYGHIEEPDF
jgi:N-acetyl-anhydromuramyl-L-alanine amidase AmpD